MSKPTRSFPFASAVVANDRLSLLPWLAILGAHPDVVHHLRRHFRSLPVSVVLAFAGEVESSNTKLHKTLCYLATHHPQVTNFIFDSLAYLLLTQYTATKDMTRPQLHELGAAINYMAMDCNSGPLGVYERGIRYSKEMRRTIGAGISTGSAEAVSFWRLALSEETLLFLGLSCTPITIQAIIDRVTTYLPRAVAQEYLLVGHSHMQTLFGNAGPSEHALS